MGCRPKEGYRSAGQAFQEIQRYGQILPDPDFSDAIRVRKKARERLPKNYSDQEWSEMITTIMREEREEQEELRKNEL